MSADVAVVKPDVTGDALPKGSDPVPPRPRTRWVKLAVYDYSPELRTTIRHVYGYRAECTCGYKGAKHRHTQDARNDKRAHEATHRKGAG